MEQPLTGVIVNPAASGGRALKAIPEITSSLSAWGVPYRLVVTTGRRDAWTQAAMLAESGAERVIAVGGDGTFNEIVNGLQESQKAIPIGFVPQGTGCDFPRTIGISSDTRTALFQACFGQTTPIDLGKATLASGESRYFLNVAGLGFDSTVAERAMRTRLRGSKTSYLSALVTSLAKFRNIAVHITTDEMSIETRAVFVTVANARFFGGGLMIAPMANISDGLLDLAIIGDVSILELVRQVPNVYRGNHTHHPKFTHMPVTTVTIEAPPDTLVQVDGELIGAAPVEFSVAAGVQPITL